MARAEGELDDITLSSSERVWAIAKARADGDLVGFGERKSCQRQCGVGVLHDGGR